MILQNFCPQVFHKPPSLRRDEFIGEVQVALETFELQKETRMWKNLEAKVEEEVSTRSC